MVEERDHEGMRRRLDDEDVWWEWRIGDSMTEVAEARDVWRWLIRDLYGRTDWIVDVSMKIGDPTAVELGLPITVAIDERDDKGEVGERKKKVE